MSPDEIIEKLVELGVNITKRTLLNYEKWDLIPKPERGAGGPGGKYTLYPANTVAEAYAAWMLMNGKYGDIDMFEGKTPIYPPVIVRQARQWNHGKDSDLFLESVEQVHQNLINVKDISVEEKAKRIESKINRLIIVAAKDIWKLETDKVKILLGMPE